MSQYNKTLAELITELQFGDYATGLVEALVTEACSLAGSECFYEAAGQVRAAIERRTPERNAKGVFLLIAPTEGGASVIRPFIPKGGAERWDLTGYNLEKTVTDMKGWYREVAPSPQPEADEFDPQKL